MYITLKLIEIKKVCKFNKIWLGFEGPKVVGFCYCVSVTLYHNKVLATDGIDGDWWSI